jgi:hypothetical protein
VIPVRVRDTIADEAIDFLAWYLYLEASLTGVLYEDIAAMPSVRRMWDNAPLVRQRYRYHAKLYLRVARGMEGEWPQARCRAKHPTDPTVSPCWLAPGHGSKDHRDDTGEHTWHVVDAAETP